MLERIRNLLAPAGEETVHITDAVDRHQTAHGDAMTAARDHAVEHRARVQTALEQVRDALEELAAFDHEHPRVQDVTRNVATKRLHQLEQFAAPDDPTAFHEQVTTLLTDLRQVTQKESAVLNHIGGAAGPVFKAIDDAESAAERLERVLNEEYATIDRHQNLKTLVADWRELHDTLQGQRRERTAIDIASVRDELEQVEDELAALDDDPEQDKKHTLETRIETLQAERKSIQRDIKRATSKMDRSLKKLLYAVENEKVDLEDNLVSMLEDVRDGVTTDYVLPVDDPENAFKQAAAALGAAGVSETQQDKFLDGAQTLQALSTHRERVQSIADDIADARAALEELEIDTKRADLEQKREQIQQRITARAERRNRLRQAIQETEAAMAETRQQIEDLLNQALRPDITVETE